MKYREVKCCAAVLFIGLSSCKQDSSRSTPPGNFGADTAAINKAIFTATSLSQDQTDSSISLTLKALAKAEDIHYAEGIANSKAGLAIQYNRKGEFVEAVANSLTAINLFDSLHFTEKKIKAELILSTIYKSIGAERKTVEYLDKGYELASQVLAVARKENFTSVIANSLNNQGIILRDMSKILHKPWLMDTAFTKYKEAISLLLEKGDENKSLPKLYNNISQIYIEQIKDYPKALEVLNEAIKLNNKYNRPDELTFNYANMSNVYIAIGDIRLAKEYALKMLELSKRLKRSHRILNSYQHNIKVNKHLNLYDSALYYTDLYISLSDSLTNLSKTGQITDMQTKYETVEKELQITKLSKSAELKRKQTILAFALSGLLALLVYLFYNRYRTKKKTSDALAVKNMEIEKQKEVIQTSLGEKETLLREIHHRVKNNLQIISSLLNIQSSHIQDEHVLSSIQEGQRRVQAMSLIHQNLYQSEHLSNVDIQNYLQQLVAYLSEMFAGQSKNIQVNVSVPDINFDIDTAIPLGLIINELVSNAYKYAFDKHGKGNINISIKPKSGNDYELEIRDNGKGLPAETNTEKSSSLGLKLVKLLSRQLRGSFSARSDNGAVFLVQFKDLRAYQLSAT